MYTKTSVNPVSRRPGGGAGEHVSEADNNTLRAFRERYGMTQAALGEMLGTKPAAVSHWETGRRPLPAYIARRLDTIRRQLAESSENLGRTIVIGEARMSDGELALFPWDSKVVTVPSPAAETDKDLRAVILRDEGRNVEINGWIAYFELENRYRENVLAIIKLKTGDGYCGFIRPNDDGDLTIESFFGQVRAKSVPVEACYPVLWMKAPSEDQGGDQNDDRDGNEAGDRPETCADSG